MNYTFYDVKGQGYVYASDFKELFKKQINLH